MNTHTQKPETLPAETKVGPFRLIKPLNASGGMATLYLAEVRERYRSADLPEQVALKVAKADYEDFLKTEAGILARLAPQRHIVQVYPLPGWSYAVFWMTDTVKTDKLRNERLCFMAMEHIDGISLRKYLEQHGRLTGAVALGIARQLADGLGNAHDRLIIHLDVKPENILLRHRSLDWLRSSSPEVVLCDFGIARDLNSRARIDRAGSPDYVAPEAFLESDPSQSAVSCPADVYMLGEVLYEMLSGHPPYDEVSLKLAGFSPPTLKGAGLRVSGQLDSILEQALARDPARRHANGKELLRDLQRVSVRTDTGVIARQAAVGSFAAALLVGAIWGGVSLLSISSTPTAAPTPMGSPVTSTRTPTPTITLTRRVTVTPRPTQKQTSTPRPATLSATAALPAPDSLPTLPTTR
jgi:serine/threonine protein kinase